jgi:iron complex outermembrane receptor protein
MPMRTSIALLVFLLLYTPSLQAQQTGVLKGTVIYATSKEPIPGASIQLADNPAKGTVTNVDGIYSVVLDTGDNKMVCSYTGRASDTFVVHIGKDAITNKDITLEPTSKLLETVVVSSGKFDQKLEELTVSMEVLKPGLINSRNSTTVETALEQTPGLTIIDNDPQIRGGSGFTFGVGSRVAIVVDGIPLLSGDAGRPEWNYIPVENIEQIEIIKGASSVLYGSSALSGVINIRSAYPHRKPKTIINYSVGYYDQPQKPAENWYGSSLPMYTNLNFLHSRIIHDNIDLVIGGNFNVDQGYAGPPLQPAPLPDDLKQALHLTDPPSFSNDDMRKVRGRLNFNFRYRSKKISGLSYGVNGNGMLDKTNMVLAWYDDSAGLYRGYPGAVFLENQKMFNLDPFVKYIKGNGVSHSLVTRVFHTDNEITNNLSNSGTLYYGEYQLQRIFKDYDFTFTGGVVGSIARSHSGLYVASGTPDNQVNNAAGYIQVDKKLWQVLNLSGGLRYEYFQTNKQQSVVAPVFRAGANLQVLKGTFVRTSYGQGFRYPTITERYIQTKAGMFGVFPNPDLKPETSTNFELGVKQGFKIGNCMGYLDLAGFYQKYENTIEYLFGIWDPSVALVGFKFQNTGDSRVRGLDISLAASTPESNKKFGLTTLIGYTYVDPVSLTPDKYYAQEKDLSGGPGDSLSYKNSSIDTTGNVLKYRFRHMVKADLECRIHRLGFGFSYRYYSKMENIDKAFETIEELTSSLKQITDIKGVNWWRTHKGFHIFDARVNVKVDEHQKISLICSNVFNVPYALRPMKIEQPRTFAVQYYCTF